jgi:hypothetical protein
MVTIATFNLENLFVPTAMKLDDANGRSAIEDHATANAIINKDAYSIADKMKLIELGKRLYELVTIVVSNPELKFKS